MIYYLIPLLLIAFPMVLAEDDSSNISIKINSHSDVVSLIDDNLASWFTTWTSTPSTSVILEDHSDSKFGTNSLQIQVNTIDGHATILHDFEDAVQDWSEFTSIEFWFKGQDTKKSLGFAIYGEPWEQLATFEFVDDSEDWKKVEFDLTQIENRKSIRGLEYSFYKGIDNAQFSIDNIQIVPSAQRKIIDDNLASWFTTWTSTPSTSVILEDHSDSKFGTNSLQIQVNTIDGHATILHDFEDAVQDWSEFTSIEFWFKGQDTKKSLGFAIYGEPWEQLATFEFVDNSVNWKKVEFDLTQIGNRKSIRGLEYSFYKGIDNAQFSIDNLQVVLSNKKSIIDDYMSSAFSTWISNEDNSITFSDNTLNTISGANSFEIDVASNTGHGTTLLDFGDALQDWSEYTTIEFWFKGNNTKESIGFAIEDKSLQHIAEFEFVDDTTDWKIIQFPLSSIESLNEIRGINFIFQEIDSTFLIDDISLYNLLDFQKPMGSFVKTDTLLVSGGIGDFEEEIPVNISITDPIGVLIYEKNFLPVQDKIHVIIEDSDNNPIPRENFSDIFYSWTSNNTDTVMISKNSDSISDYDSMQVTVNALNGPGTISHDFGIENTKNWNEYDGVHFWFKGEKTMKPVELILRDDTWSTRATHVFIDDTKHWKEVFAVFPKEDRQFDIRGLTFAFDIETVGDFLIDDINLFQTVHLVTGSYSASIPLSQKQFVNGGLYEINVQYGVSDDSTKEYFTLLIPEFINNYKHFAIFQVGDIFYAIHQDEIPLEIEKLKNHDYTTIFSSDSISDINLLVDDWKPIAHTPKLEEYVAPITVEEQGVFNVQLTIIIAAIIIGLAFGIKLYRDNKR